MLRFVERITLIMKYREIERDSEYKSIISYLHNLLENKSNKSSSIYNTLMLIIIMVSLSCLTVKKEYELVNNIDLICAIFFIIDYLLRWITSDFNKSKGLLSFLLYPFTPWAIFDLLSILPSFSILSKSFRIFKVLRVSRILKSLRIIKLARFSKKIQLLINIWHQEKETLISFLYIAAIYIFLTALIIFNVEPETFNSFFDAIYWATISLTTVGYGDIYAISVAGKIISMVSSLFGIALIALPASIITTGLLNEMNKMDN